MERIDLAIGLYDNEYSWNLRLGENRSSRLPDIVVPNAFTKEQAAKWLSQSEKDSLILDFAKKELKTLLGKILDSIDEMEMIK